MERLSPGVFVGLAQSAQHVKLLSPFFFNAHSLNISEVHF